MLRKLRKIIYIATSILGVVAINATMQPKSTQASNINDPKSEEQQQSQYRKPKKLNPNMFREDNRTQLVFNGHYLMPYIQNDPSDPQFSDPHKSHRYDVYLNGDDGLWSKPLYDNKDGYYKHHGYKIMNHYTAKILALEQIPFRIFKSYHHGEEAPQSFLIGNGRYFGWIDPDDVYQYKGKRLPVTYTNARAERKAYKLAYGKPGMINYSYAAFCHRYAKHYRHARYTKRNKWHYHRYNKYRKAHKHAKRHIAHYYEYY